MKMKYQIRLIFAGLLTGFNCQAGPYFHEGTGILLPEQIAGMPIIDERFVDYEKDSPGLGISVLYQSDSAIATVYLYTMGLKSIPNDLQSPVLRSQFEQAAGDIMRFRKGANKILEDNYAWGDFKEDAKSLHGYFSFIADGVDYRSHLHLMGFSNHFLKVRFTYAAEAQETGEELHNKFMRELRVVLDEARTDALPVLTLAARDGNSELVRDLLEQGDDLNATHAMVGTALTVAALAGQL